MPRPKVGPPIHLRLPDAALQRLDFLAGEADLSRSALARDLLLAALEGSSGQNVTDGNGSSKWDKPAPVSRPKGHAGGSRIRHEGTQAGLQKAIGKAVVGSIVDAETNTIAGLPVSDAVTTGKAEPLGKPIKQGTECDHPLTRRSWIVQGKSFNCRACKAFVRV